MFDDFPPPLPLDPLPESTPAFGFLPLLIGFVLIVILVALAIINVRENNRAHAERLIDIRSWRNRDRTIGIVFFGASTVVVIGVIAFAVR